MRWNDITVGKTTYAMAHLHPCSEVASINNVNITLRITFGFHVFTDEKNQGHPITINRETRYFSANRYTSSHQVAAFVRGPMSEGYTRGYYTRNRKEQFFCLEDQTLAVFMTIRKPHGTTDVLNVRVVSGYDVAAWGRASLPTYGKLFQMRYVLEMKNQGTRIKI